jgi:hypothetical protein
MEAERRRRLWLFEARLRLMMTDDKQSEVDDGR